jgi:hypothetical protein
VQLSGLGRDLAAAQARVAALAGLPEAVPVPRPGQVAQSLGRPLGRRDRARHRHRLGQARQRGDPGFRRRAEARAMILAALPPREPVPAGYEAAARHAVQLRLAGSAEAAGQVAQSLGRPLGRRDRARHRHRLGQALAATGGRCPACGAPAAAAHLLDGHRPGAGEAA